MFAELSEHSKSLHAALSDFMHEHVYPNERELLAPRTDEPDRWMPRPLLKSLAG